MTETDRSRPRAAHLWALGWALLPVLLAVLAAIALTASDDGSCEGFSCPSFGAAVLAMYAVAVAAPLVLVGSQLATYGLAAVAPGLRAHPVALGLLAAVLSWLLLVAGTVLVMAR